MNDGSRINSFEKFLPFIIFVLVFISYIPSLQNGFVDWDDSPLIIFNYDFRGLGLKQIKWMFSTFHMSHYQPLSWLSLALDYCVWGLNPFGYHFTNVILHAFSSALVAAISSLLFKKLKFPRAEALFGAAFAAMFWAAHPLRAESVSWITERRDVLSTALFMLSLFLYVNVFKNNSSEKLRIAFFSRSLIPCFAVYVMSCLSKSMAVTLPAILLIIDFYPLKRLNFSFEKNSGKISFLKKTADFFKKNYFGFFSAFCEKIPFFAFAAAFSFFYYFVVGKAIDVPYIADYMPSAAKAIYAYWFYLWKTILPIGLSPVYVPPQGGYLLVNSVGGLFLLLIAWYAVRNIRRFPGFAAALAFYAVSLLPACGLLNGAPVPAADRYSYIPCIGISVLLGGILASLAKKYSESAAGKICVAFSLIWILLIINAGAMQQRVWKNSSSVWNWTVSVEPRSAIAYNNLASIAYAKGDKVKAEALMLYAMSLAPSDFNITFNCANLYSMNGDMEKAAEFYSKVIEAAPTYYNAYIKKAESELSLGKNMEAEDTLSAAADVRPQYPTAWHGLAMLRMDMKNYAGAEKAALKAAEFLSAPNDISESYFIAAIAASHQGNLQYSAELSKKAVNAYPGNAEAAEFLARLEKLLNARAGE